MTITITIYYTVSQAAVTNCSFHQPFKEKIMRLTNFFHFFIGSIIGLALVFVLVIEIITPLVQSVTIVNPLRVMSCGVVTATAFAFTSAFGQPRSKTIAIKVALGIFFPFACFATYVALF
jgi:hypothetical protein